VNIMFATCAPNSALAFIRQMYPNQKVEWEMMPLLEELIKQDILRVQDPNFHQPCQIVPGNNYRKEHDGQIQEAINEFVANVHERG
jgi:hypothetical protein